MLELENDWNCAVDISQYGSRQQNSVPYQTREHLVRNNIQGKVDPQ